MTTQRLSIRVAAQQASTAATVVAENIEEFDEEILAGDKAREAMVNRLLKLQKITITYSPTAEADTVMIYSFRNVVAGFAYVVVDESGEHTYIDLLWTNLGVRCNRFGSQMVSKIKTHFSNRLLVLNSIYNALPFWLKMHFETWDTEFNKK